MNKKCNIFTHLKKRSSSDLNPKPRYCYINRKARRELEKKAIMLIDERYNYLVNELNKESKNRNESLENFHKIIESDIPKIQENLKDEQNEMIENDNTISLKLNEETSKLINLVMNEKRAREETEEALLEMLKAMINAMKTQLENERRER
jgi:hypothetical protein